jgi:hypothetical protein
VRVVEGREETRVAHEGGLYLPAVADQDDGKGDPYFTGSATVWLEMLASLRALTQVQRSPIRLRR